MSPGRQRNQHAKHSNRAKCCVGPELLEQLSFGKQRLVFGGHAFPFRGIPNVERFLIFRSVLLIDRSNDFGHHSIGARHSVHSRYEAQRGHRKRQNAFMHGSSTLTDLARGSYGSNAGFGITPRNRGRPSRTPRATSRVADAPWRSMVSGQERRPTLGSRTRLSRDHSSQPSRQSRVGP